MKDMDPIHREKALEIFNTALDAVDPRGCVLEHLGVRGSTLIVDKREYDLDAYDSVHVVSFGKAAPAMASAVEHTLGTRITGGYVVCNSAYSPGFQRLKFLRASHPMPDERSMDAARDVVKLLEGAGEKDLVIFLISGGGSALLALPAQGITLGDKQRATEVMLKSGVDTYGLNLVRKHISDIKGGGLLKKALPAEVVTLILSDVIGDHLDVIASGPTVPDGSSFEDAWHVIDDYKLENKLPPRVIVHLEEGRLGTAPDTLKSGEFDESRVETVIVGSNYKALRAAERKAGEMGYNTLLLTSQIKGEAREVAKAIAGIAFDVERFDIPVKKPACIVFGGETTVTVTGKGKGGRCIETALSFAIEVMGHDILGLFCGTDGIDGPTDAAGAVSDGTVRARARRINLSARGSLLSNDSYTFFDKVGGLVKIGPTGTNVMDIGVVILV